MSRKSLLRLGRLVKGRRLPGVACDQGDYDLSGNVGDVY